MTEAKQSIFDKIYGKGKEVIDEMKKPLERRKLIRKFKAAYDDCTTKIQEAEEKLQATYEKLAEMKIDDLVRAHQSVKDAKEVMQIIREEYHLMFGKELKVEEDE